MTKVTVGEGVRLNYRVAGSGRTLLFHPGFANTLDVWNWVVAELSATHRCVTFDPRGHGASDAPDSDYTLDEMAADVIALIERLDLTDVTLVGHSLGGAVGLRTVLEHNTAGRITGLALVAPAVPCFVKPDDLEIGTPIDAFDGVLAGLSESWVESILGAAGAFYHRTDAATAGWLAGKSLEMPAHLGLRYFRQLASIDFRARLADVTVPVLVAWGAQDQMADPRWAGWLRERNLPRWSVELIEDAGHGAMVDQPARLADLLRGFTATAPEDSSEQPRQQGRREVTAGARLDEELRAAFIEAMAGVCTPVSVVTAMDGDRPHGTTVSAFTSLSVSPPMVLVSLDRKSDLLPLVRDGGRFGLNVLGSDHAQLAGNFARKGKEKFADVSWRREHDLPRIAGAAGWVACTVTDLVDGGDHVIALGTVVAAETTATQPLTYHGRAFGTHRALDGSRT
ncbi:alpha/beta fold hydrolase [Nonomuraea lactucae]|uniref:alpha/beta fold hydrolase n=1 Tax=Nonomuraea lactucae TaxID=2249762 RepID=UPI000DE1C0D9|nr:alpha/beta fold hydrolase [Nonomuraea lactucae]